MASGDVVVGFGIGTVAAWLIIFAIVMGLVGCPKYKIWEQEQVGRAEYSKAEYNRKIQVLEAEAGKEAAKFRAEAEIIRSQGLAKSNEIVANGLGGPEGYLRYLWIQGLDRSNTIYIPTEAGLPILEAGRRGDSK